MEEDSIVSRLLSGTLGFDSATQSVPNPLGHTPDSRMLNTSPFIIMSSLSSWPQKGWGSND